MKPFLYQKIIQGLGLTLVAGIAATAPASPITMNRSAVAGGGGTSAGGNFSLGGTVGQPAAVPSVSSRYSLAAGFWATEYVAVQVSGAPWLTLTRSGANVILSWPSTAVGFSLKSSADLSAKSSWTTVPQSAALVGGQYQVTLPATQAKQFFRLSH